jgi:hypothetical protein
MDCDMLMREDVAALWRLRDERYAVQVVKHHHVPRRTPSSSARSRRSTRRRTWSSVMLMNCERCTALTPDFVNTASGLELHQFKWLGNGRAHRRDPVGLEPLVGTTRRAPTRRSCTSPSAARISRNTATASTPRSGAERAPGNARGEPAREGARLTGPRFAGLAAMTFEEALRDARGHHARGELATRSKATAAPCSTIRGRPRRGT